MNGINATRADFYRVEGWLISLFLHGLLLSTALPLFRLVPINIPPEPFRWDINLVRSTQVTHEQTIEARATERHVTSYTAPAAIPAEVQNTSRTPASYAGSHKPVSSIHESAVATEAPLRNVSSTVPMETTSIVQESAQSHNVAAEVTEPVSSSSASENSSVPASFTNDSSGPESEPIAHPRDTRTTGTSSCCDGYRQHKGSRFRGRCTKATRGYNPCRGRLFFGTTHRLQLAAASDLPAVGGTQTVIPTVARSLKPPQGVGQSRRVE